MTQNEIIKALADKTGVSAKEVKEVLQAQAELAATTLKSADEFTLLGFGKLKAKTSKERTGRNPSTGAEVKIKSARQVRLAVGKAVDRKGNPLTVKLQGPVEPYFQAGDAADAVEEG